MDSEEAKVRMDLEFFKIDEMISENNPFSFF